MKLRVATSTTDFLQISSPEVLGVGSGAGLEFLLTQQGDGEVCCSLCSLSCLNFRYDYYSYFSLLLWSRFTLLSLPPSLLVLLPVIQMEQGEAPLPRNYMTLPPISPRSWCFLLVKMLCGFKKSFVSRKKKKIFYFVNYQ